MQLNKTCNVQSMYIIMYIHTYCEATKYICISSCIRKYIHACTYTLTCACHKQAYMFNCSYTHT